MAIRVKGGVFNDQVLTGELTHYRVLGADFSGAYSDGTHNIPNGSGPGISYVVPAGKPIPGSAAEVILTQLEIKATVVIMNPDVSGCGLHFAIENSDNDWISALEIEFMIQSLGSSVGVDDVDCIPCNVEIVPYLLGDPCSVCSSTFLELTDTPLSYTGESGKLATVNATEDGLIFTSVTGAGLVDSVFGRIGDVTAEAGDYAAFYATTLQGIKADSALQPGQVNNVSELINDAVYLTAATGLQVGDPVSSLANDAGYLTLSNVPVNSVAGKIGVVNLEISDLIDVDTTGVVDGQILIWNATASEWQPQNNTGGGGGEANTASNLGTGTGTFAAKSGLDLQFKSLVAGPNITITADGTEITISSSGSGSSAVDSVFGRTGVVVATEGDYTIDQLGDVDTTTVAPNVGEVLEWNGTNWVPTTIAASVTQVTNINGQPTLTLVDTTRSNKILSVAEQTLIYTKNRLNDLDWIPMGNATGADSGFIADFDGTVVSVTAHCDDTNVSSKDIELYLDGVSQGVIATLSGGSNVSTQNQTLNFDFAQGQKIRVRATNGIAGRIEDTVVKLVTKWRG